MVEVNSGAPSDDIGFGVVSEPVPGVEVVDIFRLYMGWFRSPAGKPVACWCPMAKQDINRHRGLENLLPLQLAEQRSERAVSIIVTVVEREGKPSCRWVATTCSALDLISGDHVEVTSVQGHARLVEAVAEFVRDTYYLDIAHYPTWFPVV